MSVETLAPVTAKAVSGSLMAHKRSAFFANILRMRLDFLSIVPFVVIIATIPPGRARSNALRKK